MKTCDIIIPTYNGAAKLMQHVIPALREQAIPAGWRIRLIICDDGSENVYRDRFIWEAPWKKPIILALSHGGRSKARNAGIDASSADMLLLLADDIILLPGALFEHLTFHEHSRDSHQAALGCIMWDPRVMHTPFMDWMMHGGQQNDYDSILGTSICESSHFFYGSFLSLKKEFLGTDRFSETFMLYGWEDLELGERLQKKGLSLMVLHNARALHRHMYTATAILKRQQLVGAGMGHVNTSNARRLRHLLYRTSGVRAFLVKLIKIYGNSLNTPWLFTYVTAGEFWYGVFNSQRIRILFTDKPVLSTDLSTIIPQTRSIFAILVHFGAKEVTDRAVHSLMNGSRKPDHCIVINHGDIPDSPQNKGYAAGLTEGIRQAAASGAQEHDLIILLNNDCEIEQSGIASLSIWWSTYGNATTLAGTSWGTVSLVTGRADVTHNNLVNDFSHIPYIHGSCIVLEYSLARSLVFPEDFFMYWEDVALSLRAKKMGATLKRISFPFARHNDAIMSPSLSKLYYLVRNGAYVLEHDVAYGWRMHWKMVNTMRYIYHAFQHSGKHRGIARALRDARHGNLGKALL